MTATIAITFDNLGEASELARGQWPADRPLGEHASVTRALPALVALLGELELTATFFVEGVNAQLYPGALMTLAEAGHEVALHGWRHEPWAALSADRQRELLERGFTALNKLGLVPEGFRPPGGVLAPSAWAVLREAGFAYCSPAGSGVGTRDGLAVLPFDWTLIDAFHYLPHFGDRRAAALGTSQALTPEDLRARMGRAVRETVSSDGFLALLFHPFLADTSARMAVIEAVLGDVATAVADATACCAPMRELAGPVQAGALTGAGPLALAAD